MHYFFKEVIFMEQSNFFAMLSRMKYINRWGLMNNTRTENISEHSIQTAIIAHALCVIHNKRFNGNIDADKIAVAAMFHDVSEIITGDMPTPVKYYNTAIVEAYKKVEEIAVDKLLSMLPDDLREEYSPVLNFERENKELYRFVKAADKISALIKCTEEQMTGSREFDKAKKTLEKDLENMNMPEIDVFLKEFLPAFRLTLDEQG